MKTQIKKILFILGVIYCCLLPHTAHAQEISSNLMWSYDLINNQAVNVSPRSTSVTSVTIPHKIDGYVVGSLKEGAFANASRLVKVIIEADNLSEIPALCFKGCSLLQDVKIQSSNLLTIGTSAFQDCTALRTMNHDTGLCIPSSVKHIRGNAFSGCTSVKKIYATKNILVIEDGAFATSTETDTSIYTNNTYVKNSKSHGSIWSGRKLTFYDYCNMFVTILNESSLVYTGRALSPNVLVLDNTGKILTNGVHYTLTYLNNVNIGSGNALSSSPYVKVQATLTGEGEGTIYRTFTITPRNLSDVTVSNIENQEYRGGVLTPSTNLTYLGGHLVENTDYTAEYRNNVVVGTATVLLTGKGNFIGTKEVNFTITPSTKTIETENSSQTIPTTTKPNTEDKSEDIEKYIADSIQTSGPTGKTKPKKAVLTQRKNKLTIKKYKNVAYEVYQKISGGSWKKIEIIRTPNKFAIKINKKKTYQYKVRMYRMNGKKKLSGKFSKARKIPKSKTVTFSFK